MTDFFGSATGFESESGCCRWVAPEGGSAIVMAAGVVRHLKEQVLEGFHALPKRGAEVGGILLGRFVDGESPQIRIDAFDPVPCEYRFGPSFILSDADRLKLGEVLERRRSDPDLVVVGYYRSCTGRELALDTADEQLLRAHFADSKQIFLTVKPVSSQKCVASFFCWHDGKLPSEPAKDSFPFDTSNAAPEEKPVLPLNGSAKGKAEHLPAGRTPSIAPQPRERRSAVSLVLRPRDAEVQQAVEVLGSMLPGQARKLFGRWVPEARGQRPWQLLSIALAILAGCSILYLLSSSRQPALPHLGLDVKQAANGMEVVWDSRAPAAQTAERGVLSITDGSAEKTIQLSASDVARGKFPYQGSGSKLRIRLSLYGDGNRVATESFGVMAVAQPAPKPAEVPAEPPPAVAPEPSVQEAKAPEAAPQPVPAAEPVKVNEPVKVKKQTPRPKATSPTRAAVQAVAVHEVRPGVPDGIKNRLRRPIVVPVRVQISASGKVTGVTPHKDGNALFRYLAERAAVAAKSWRFRPARSRDGTAVPTEKTLYFVFKS